MREVRDDFGYARPRLEDPPTRLGIQALTFLTEFPGATHGDLRRYLELSDQATGSLVGDLIFTGHIERDGMGGYTSTGRWHPGEGGEPDVVLATAYTIAKREGERDATDQAGGEEVRTGPQGHHVERQEWEV